MTRLEDALIARSVMKEANDCSVLALAMSCLTTYHSAHTALKIAGRRDRHGVFPEHIRHATRTLGHTFGPMLRPKQSNGSKYTPKTLAKAYPKGRYLAFSRDHVFALIDGKVQDWHEGRRYHIINVYQLKEKTT